MTQNIQFLCLRLTILLAGLFGVLPGRAQIDTLAADKERFTVSLLTCAPGAEAYELYGHTALRVVSDRGNDWTFNFGIFDFTTPGFTRRFLLGETDYTLGVMPTSYFLRMYEHAGRSVDEQVFDLTEKESERVVAHLDSLAHLVSKEGWTYRYNIFYDNCTTRAVKLVSNCIDGELTWNAPARPSTFRTIVHEYADSRSPWSSFGQDLALGREADVPIGRDEQMFAPLYAARFLDSAMVVRRDGSRRPLVAHRGIVAQGSPSMQEDPHLFTPVVAASLLLVLAAALSLRDRRRGHASVVFDGMLMLVQGLAGCIIAALFFASLHPTVGSNFFILLLNPLPLVLFALLWLKGKHTQGLRRGHVIALRAEAVMATVMLAVALLGLQDVPLAGTLLAATLLLRAVSGLMINRKSYKG